MMETTLKTPFYKNLTKEDQETAKFLKEEITSLNVTQYNTTSSYNTTVVGAKNSTPLLLPTDNNKQNSEHHGGNTWGKADTLLVSSAFFGSTVVAGLLYKLFHYFWDKEYKLVGKTAVLTRGGHLTKSGDNEEAEKGKKDSTELVAVQEEDNPLLKAKESNLPTKNLNGDMQKGTLMSVVPLGQELETKSLSQATIADSDDEEYVLSGDAAAYSELTVPC